jgi:hypothetical protein
MVPTTVIDRDDTGGLPVDSPAFVVVAATAAAVLVVTLWRLLVVPAVLRRRARSLARSTESARTAAHWRRAARCIEVLGVPFDPSSTPLEFARAAAHVVDDPPVVERLAHLATRATFSPTEMSEEEADGAAHLADAVERGCRASLSGAQRWRATVDPWFLVTPRHRRRG